MEGLEVVIQDGEKGAEVIRRARGPYMFQGESGAAFASLPKGEISMPGVSNRER